MTFVLVFNNGDQAWGWGAADEGYVFVERFGPDTFDPVWEIHVNGGNDYLWLGLNDGLLVGVALAMYGGTGNDTFCGFNGDDTIDGGEGNDWYFDSSGSDTYLVNSSGDTITENYFSTDGKGIDLVIASIDYALPPNMESLRLAGQANLGGSGNIYANTITGNSGDNILDGLQGGDTLIGGKGDDVYVIDSSFDQVIELSGEGLDIIETGVSYTLSAFVEQGFLASAGRNQSLTGNALGNLLVGNSGTNTLSGLDGKDELQGEGGQRHAGGRHRD